MTQSERPASQAGDIDHHWFGRHADRSIARVGVWAAVGQAGGSLLSLVGTVVLSRLLEPAEVGLFTLAFTFYSIPSMIVGPGLTSAAVQAPHLTREQSSNLFWINTLANGVLALLLVAAAPFLADYYKQPQLHGLCQVFAIILVLEGVATQYRALLQRALRFDLITKINLLVGVVGLAVALILAWLGFGVWALAMQVLLTAILDRAALATVVRWRPSWFCRGSGTRALMRFSGASSLALGIHMLYTQSQTLLIARYASVADVGYYGRGQALFQKPFSQLMAPLYAILLPVFSARQCDASELGKAVYRANCVLYTSICPLIAWMILSGPDIASALLGDQWICAGETLRFFAIAALPVVLFGAIHRMNEAAGRPAWGVGLRALFLPILLVALMLAAPNGAVWMAAASAAVELVSAPFFLLLLLQQSPISPNFYLKPICNCILALSMTVGTLFWVNPSSLFALEAPVSRAAATLLASYLVGLGYAAVFQFGRDGIRDCAGALSHVYSWLRNVESHATGM